MQEPRYFSPSALNHIVWDATYMMAKYGKESKKINKKFKSSIMMAVTNVNGCRVCSYYHTSELLKAGASQAELKDILEATYQNMDPQDATALLFAEHYADTSGNYDKAAFEKVKDYYGQEIALGILVTIKEIMFGNVYGISLGHFKDRFRFKKTHNSKFLTDLYIVIAPLFLMPFSFFINLFRKKKDF